MNIYGWKGGSTHRRGIDPNLVGQVVEEIAEEKGGCTPADLVEAARPQNSPVHNLWDWNVDEAAEKWFRQEARQVINHLILVPHEDAEEKDCPQGFYSVIVKEEEGEQERRYVSRDRVMSDDQLRRVVERDVLAQLRGLERRFDHLHSFKPVWLALDKVEMELRDERPEETDENGEEAE